LKLIFWCYFIIIEHIPSQKYYKEAGAVFRTWKIAGAIATIVLCAAAGGLYHMTRVLRINEAIVDAYINKEDSYQQYKRIILRSVLFNTGLWREWECSEETSVSITMGRVRGRQKEAVITVRCRKGKSVVALYEKRNGNFVYSSIVNKFADLQDIQIMPLRDQGSSLIVVRERSGFGTLEEITSISAYVWDNRQFAEVLNINESYKAYYSKPSDDWIRVSERSDIIWEDSDAPVIRVLMRQNYALGKSTNRKGHPNESEFEIIRSRSIMEEYVWSGEWMHFILFEGTDLQSGEPVAVIEDLSESPLGLFEQLNKETGKYRIKNLDGIIEVVDKERIMPSIEIKRTRQI